MNDLIDDNPIEEDDSEDEGSDGSRKRKKSDDEDELSDRLEDDDYDLIEENLGVKVQRVSVCDFATIGFNKREICRFVVKSVFRIHNGFF